MPGVVQYGVVYVPYGIVWSGLCTIWYGIVWCSLCTVWYSPAWYSMEWSMCRMVQSGMVQRDPPYPTSRSLDPVAIRPIRPITPISLISPIYKTTSPSPHPSRGARRGSCFLAILLLLWDEVPASGEGVRIVLLDEDVALWV